MPNEHDVLSEMSYLFLHKASKFENNASIFKN